ncbi:MAG: hypothetical protein D6778_11010 [Nitrospirae bacterium]|nr:MAG: hypothetical protein D6778_11010 [Nitrospirota bacterium]
MQRLSWNTLRDNWIDLYFFEPLSAFMTRLHEDRGKDVLAVVVFSPEPDLPVPPPKPPLYLMVLYRGEVDFLKENLFLRERDPSGILKFFPYSLDGFVQMLRDGHPIAHWAMKTGLVIHELEDCLEGIAEN